MQTMLLRHGIMLLCSATARNKKGGRRLVYTLVL